VRATPLFSLKTRLARHTYLHDASQHDRSPGPFRYNRSLTPQQAEGSGSKMETVLLHFLALRSLLRDAQIAFPAASCRELQ